MINCFHLIKILHLNCISIDEVIVFQKNEDFELQIISSYGIDIFNPDLFIQIITELVDPIFTLIMQNKTFTQRMLKFIWLYDMMYHLTI